MSNKAHVLGVIPARLASTRLPRKVLREIAGKPMLAWVYEAAKACPGLDDLIVAADSEEVAALCRKNGWSVMMTPAELPSGTDRVREIAREYPADIYVNIQGDEPLLKPEHIDALLEPFGRAEVDVTTIKTLCAPENVNNPNAVKVVTALDGRALYFSRATIPYDRDQRGDVPYWKHIGLYAYRRQTLERFTELGQSDLEQIERLEQLRLLENGFSLYVTAVEFDTIGVDTEADLRAAEAILRATS